MQKSLTLQPCRPLPGILNLGNTGIGVFPQVEEYLIKLYGFAYFHSKFIFVNNVLNLKSSKRGTFPTVSFHKMRSQ